MASKNDDIENKHKQLVKENEAHLQDTLRNVISLKEDKTTGEATWLGMKVDEKVKPLISGLTSKFIPYINKTGAPVVGSLFEAAARAMRLNPAATKNANTLGNLSFLWSTVFFQQISELTSVSAEYAKQRKELFKEFKPIVEATGASIAGNEVMKTEYDRASGNWSASVKDMAADLTTLIPNVMIALQQQNQLLGKQPIDFGKIFKKGELPAAEGGAKVDPIRAEIERLTEERIADLHPKYRTPEGERKIAEEVARELRGGGKNDKAGDLLNPDNIMDHALTLGAIASPTIKAMIGTKVDESPTAWEMIKKLRHEVEGFCTRKGNDCEFTPPDPDRIRIDGESLSEYLVAIFQENEKNRGRAEIAGVNLERLQDATQLIADGLVKGVIDANSLVVLVGEHKVISHGKDGETTIADEDTLAQTLETMSAKLGRKIDLTPEEFFKAFTNKEAIEKEITANLKSLQGTERACFMALLPDKVLEGVGIKEDEIRAARVQARDHMHAIVDGYVRNLAQVIEDSPPEHVRELGLTKKNVAMLKRLVEAMDGPEKEHALQSVVEGHHKDVMALIASVMLNQQKESPAQFTQEWTKFVAQTSAARKEAAQEATSEQAKSEETHASDAVTLTSETKSGFASKTQKHSERVRSDSVLAMGAGAAL